MFRKIYDKMEYFIIELEIIRKNQIDILELKIIVFEIKNFVDEVNSYCIIVDERINEVKDRLVENNCSKEIIE